MPVLETVREGRGTERLHMCVGERESDRRSVCVCVTEIEREIRIVGSVCL